MRAFPGGDIQSCFMPPARVGGADLPREIRDQSPNWQHVTILPDASPRTGHGIGKSASSRCD